MKKNILTLFVLLLILLVSSCKRNKDEAPSPQDQNEEELITTISLIIKDNGTLVDTFSFRDPDGAGGIAPTVDDIILDANKTYSCSLLLLDETKTPADTVSHEIEEEKNAHQFFFEYSGSNFYFSYEDYDDHGVPVGLETTLETKAAGTGQVTIILKHQPGIKPKDGSSGNVGLGETDAEVTFNVIVQ